MQHQRIRAYMHVVLIDVLSIARSWSTHVCFRCSVRAILYVYARCVMYHFPNSIYNILHFSVVVFYPLVSHTVAHAYEATRRCNSDLSATYAVVSTSMDFYWYVADSRIFKLSSTTFSS